MRLHNIVCPRTSLSPFRVGVLLLLMAGPVVERVHARATPIAAVTFVESIVVSGDSFLVAGVTLTPLGPPLGSRRARPPPTCEDATVDTAAASRRRSCCARCCVPPPGRCARVPELEGQLFPATGGALSPHAVRCRLPRHSAPTEASDVAEMLLRSGYAFADRSEPATYLRAASAAAEAEAGLWRGRFVFPWEWRER